MYQYSPSEWLLFFYIYCFCGWVWECCYVSVKERKWVNRGFLHGPFLPIYGSGAVCVLIMTIPVKDSLPAVFFMGMLGATVLEYCTGSVMEKIFGVRYWDYSHVPLNLHGHICLMASLGWGIFSVVMIRVAHTPVERLVLSVPSVLQETMAILISVIFTVDFTKSFQEAMDLKELIVRLTEGNEEIRRLQKRMDVIIAVLNDETDGLKEKAGEGLRRYSEYVKEYREKLEENVNYLAEQLSIKGREEEKAMKGESKLDEELEGMRISIRNLKRLFELNKKREFISSSRILRRNPGAFSKEYAEALKEVQKMDEENK